MAKKESNAPFFNARQNVLDNLDAIRQALVLCIAEGMIDSDAELYNETISLIQEIDVVEDWNELEEMIMEAKALEKDTAVWFSMEGRTSISLPWPKRPE